jgi:hypothetical protein
MRGSEYNLLAVKDRITIIAPQTDRDKIVATATIEGASAFNGKRIEALPQSSG